jgi:hypothetical protein
LVITHLGKHKSICVHLCTNVCISIEWKYVMRMYVVYVWKQNWWRVKAQRDRDKESETGKQHKAQGIAPYLFSFKQAVWKKQDHSLQSFVYINLKYTYFNFQFWYSFEKCCRYAIVISKARHWFSFFQYALWKGASKIKWEYMLFTLVKWFQAIFALNNGIHESIY